jgi:hypothetical protein
MRLWRIAAAVVVALLAVSSLGLGVAAEPDSPGSERSRSAAGLQVVLIADDRHVGARRVPPPARAVRGIQSATFTVNWNPGTCGGTTTSWPSNAQTAFLYAVDVWSSLIQSSVTIEVDACWRTDLGGLTLGSAGSTTIHHDEAEFPYSNTWYVAALGNQLTGTDLNGGTAEIRASFNAGLGSWYFGTDGITPAGRYDFVTVVVHELCHGLGFHGYMYVSGGLGYRQWSGYPAAYDRFTEDGTAKSLFSYTNASVALASALQGGVGGIYFDGPNANEGNGGSRVKLYAPTPWVQGSSYSHVDTIYDATPNALMTWSLNLQESIHDPGPIALGMLEDIGWTMDWVDVTIAKQIVGGGVNVLPAGPVTMTLTIGNSGTVTATAVVVTDTLSSDVLSPSYDASLTITPTGVVSYAWLVADLPPGASDVITIYGTISATLPSDFAIVNTASISTDQMEDDTDNNTSTAIIGGSAAFLPLVLRSY